MKTKLHSILALALILFAVGCSSPQRTAYHSIGAIAVTVDGAMKGWGDYVRAGRAEDAQQQQVFNAYLAYQSAMQKAQALVKQTTETDQPNYLLAVNAAGAAADVVLQLVHQNQATKGTKP